MSDLDYWARSLSNPRLADDLRKLASNVRWTNPEERAVRLNEAARRLDETETPPPAQTLVTLGDSQQVAIIDGVVRFRRYVGATWFLPAKQSPKPHVPGTYYIGEW